MTLVLVLATATLALGLTALLISRVGTAGAALAALVSSPLLLALLPHSPLVVSVIASLIWSGLVLTSLDAASAKAPLMAPALTSIFAGALLMLTSSSPFLAVLGFELMMLPSLFLLRTFSKADRSTEALRELYLWSVAGSLILVAALAFSYSGALGAAPASLIFVAGFSIKVPLWPFTSWLLKAHVEASTEFSIFLSGFLVKFGVIGLVSTLSSLGGGLGLEAVRALAVLGLVDSTIRLWGQADLKRIVALTTIIETNWLALSLSYPAAGLAGVALALVLVHALTTTIEFYLVEAVYKRYGTRSALGVRALGSLYPNLGLTWLFSTAVIIGLPGTAVFSLKFAFLLQLIQLDPALFALSSLIFLLVLPVFFIRLALVLRGGHAAPAPLPRPDLSPGEAALILPPLVLVSLFGLILFLFIKCP